MNNDNTPDTFKTTSAMLNDRIEDETLINKTMTTREVRSIAGILKTIVNPDTNDRIAIQDWEKEELKLASKKETNDSLDKTIQKMVDEQSQEPKNIANPNR